DIAVNDLLDQGSWVVQQSLRVCHDARALGDNNLDVLLKYRHHRFRAISGGSVDAALINTLHDLLEAAPGNAFCDACLAFAYTASLVEIREITSALLRVEPQHFQPAASCAICGRTVPSVLYK